MVVKGSDLDALSDDPTELQNELQALAGPAAGPNGGQIYIDGFEGGQIPPKSSILEIRVNQNPFSAEFDRIGYGRIEIITKPGTQKLHGSVNSYGNDSALNTSNPFLAQKPSYFQYGVYGDISGPLSKTATWYFHFSRNDNEVQTVVNALNPQNTSQNITLAFPTPNTYLSLGPRIDFQLGKSHTITFRDAFYPGNAIEQRRRHPQPHLRWLPTEARITTRSNSATHISSAPDSSTKRVSSGTVRAATKHLIRLLPPSPCKAQLQPAAAALAKLKIIPTSSCCRITPP